VAEGTQRASRARRGGSRPGVLCACRRVARTIPQTGQSSSRTRSGSQCCAGSRGAPGDEFVFDTPPAARCFPARCHLRCETACPSIAHPNRARALQSSAFYRVVALTAPRLFLDKPGTSDRGMHLAFRLVYRVKCGSPKKGMRHESS
jgi:hypothetical protein